MTVSVSTRLQVIVVGYDGSPAAQHALERAADLTRGRDGILEVVFVAHPPVGATLSPLAYTDLMQALDNETVRLADEVRTRLEGRTEPWHFQRRDGSVSAELQAVATDLQRQYGHQADITIAVGGPSHRIHHVIGSVGASLVHTDRFPIVVVP